MSKLLYDLSHGLPSFGFIYGVALAAYLIGLVRGRAPFSSMLWAPVVTVVLILVEAVFYNLLLEPLAHHFGMPRDGLGDFVMGILYDVIVNYGWGRFIALPRASQDTVHRRGAVVAAR